MPTDGYIGRGEVIPVFRTGATDNLLLVLNEDVVHPMDRVVKHTVLNRQPVRQPGR